ncbi:MAG: YbaN family protein [Novibacillus thermophilus]
MKRQLKNSLLITFGSIAFVFGILGVFLPLVPTTPLLLLAAACYVRSSQKLYRWLIHNKWFGQYIENFRSGQGIPLRAKVSGIVVLWLTIGITAVFVVPLHAVKIALFLIAAVVTWYILSFKTLKS